VESNGWFLAIKLIARISGPGHQPPLAVTSKFLVAGRIEWLVFGDQVDRENFRTRPQAARGLSGGYGSNEPWPALHRFSEADTQEAGALRNLPDGQSELLGHYCHWLRIASCQQCAG